MATFAAAPPADPIQTVRQLYRMYCAFGKGHRVKIAQLQMDGRAFVKFLRDARLITSNCTRTDADLIFTKVKARGSRTITFDGFLAALNEVSIRKGAEWGTLIHHIVNTVQGPSMTGTSKAEYVPFHDDKNTYTGVYKKGGPTNVGSGDGHTHVTLEKLADRSPYDVRGRKIQPKKETNYEFLRKKRVRQRRLSSQGQQMLQNVMQPQNSPQQRAAPAPAPARPQTAGGAGGYAKLAEMRRTAERPKTARSRNESGDSQGSIFDRLTDTSQYTGTHKHRFDDEGRGRGLDGRDITSKGSGTSSFRYAGNTAAKGFKGNTNTNTDVIYSDLSQFITRR